MDSICHMQVYTWDGRSGEVVGGGGGGAWFQNVVW